MVLWNVESGFCWVLIHLDCGTREAMESVASSKRTNECVRKGTA